MGRGDEGLGRIFPSITLIRIQQTPRAVGDGVTVRLARRITQSCVDGHFTPLAV